MKVLHSVLYSDRCYRKRKGRAGEGWPGVMGAGGSVKEGGQNSLVEKWQSSKCQALRERGERRCWVYQGLGFPRPL